MGALTQVLLRVGLQDNETSGSQTLLHIVERYRTYIAKTINDTADPVYCWSELVTAAHINASLIKIEM